MSSSEGFRRGGQVKYFADLRRLTVNPDDYPGYLEAVGGEDKMMDFQTMQGRLDNREYRDFDQISVSANILPCQMSLLMNIRRI